MREPLPDGEVISAEVEERSVEKEKKKLKYQC